MQGVAGLAAIPPTPLPCWPCRSDLNLIPTTLDAERSGDARFNLTGVQLPFAQFKKGEPLPLGQTRRVHAPAPPPLPSCIDLPAASTKPPPPTHTHTKAASTPCLAPPAGQEIMVHSGFLAAYDSVKVKVFRLIDQLTGVADNGRCVPAPKARHHPAALPASLTGPAACPPVARPMPACCTARSSDGPCHAHARLPHACLLHCPQL
jgi:hypothetical protein